MTHRKALTKQVIAISISESSDMPALGLTDAHLRDAMAEIARHLLAGGASLVYGGDLRKGGFTELLFELVSRHRVDADPNDPHAARNDLATAVRWFVAWSIHAPLAATALDQLAADLAGVAEAVYLTLDGRRMTKSERAALQPQQPSEDDWSQALTAMRRTMREESDARIVLGGRVDGYKGVMPGIAEEALESLRNKQPLFLLGGFGGCAHDIAELVGLIAPTRASRPTWPGQQHFAGFTPACLHNDLTDAENATLARTVHVDQAVVLVLRGLLRLNQRASAMRG